MATFDVTFHFKPNDYTKGTEVQRNFDDLVAGLNTLVFQESYTAASAADVSGPAGTGLLLLVRDHTGGGTALVLYETAQTPLIIGQQGGTTTWTVAAPGANEIQVKDNAGAGVSFRAHASTNSNAIKAAVFIVDQS